MSVHCFDLRRLLNTACIISILSLPTVASVEARSGATSAEVCADFKRILDDTSYRAAVQVRYGKPTSLLDDPRFKREISKCQTQVWSNKTSVSTALASPPSAGTVAPSQATALVASDPVAEKSSAAGGQISDSERKMREALNWSKQSKHPTAREPLPGPANVAPSDAVTIPQSKAIHVATGSTNPSRIGGFTEAQLDAMPDFRRQAILRDRGTSREAGISEEEKGRRQQSEIDAIAADESKLSLTQKLNRDGRGSSTLAAAIGDADQGTVANATAARSDKLPASSSQLIETKKCSQALRISKDPVFSSKKLETTDSELLMGLALCPDAVLKAVNEAAESSHSEGAIHSRIASVISDWEDAQRMRAAPAPPTSTDEVQAWVKREQQKADDKQSAEKNAMTPTQAKIMGMIGLGIGTVVVLQAQENERFSHLTPEEQARVRRRQAEESENSSPSYFDPNKEWHDWGGEGPAPF